MEENSTNPVLDEDDTPLTEELSQAIDNTVAEVFEMEVPAKEETPPDADAQEDAVDSEEGAEATESEETKEAEAETAETEAKDEASGIPIPPEELLKGLAGKAEEDLKETPKEEAKQEAETPKEPQIPVRQPRNFAAEFLELAHMYPDLQGKTIPNEVFKKASQTEHSVLSCYNEYLINRQKTELEQLRREVKTLRQNEENARRAPVKPSGTHPAQPGKSDPFMDAWNSLN